MRPALGSVLVPILWIASAGAAPSAQSLVQKAEDNVRGVSQQAKVSMEVTRDGTSRKYAFRMWGIGNEKAFVRILEPVKNRGTTHLRIAYELWQYIPNVDRVVRIPTSMMLQPWMGSDFTNDDLTRTSSLARDYTHKILGSEPRGAETVYEIESVPKPKSPVVWGKVKIWVAEPDGKPVRQEFYSERGKLVKILECKEFKKIGKYHFPTTFTMSKADQPGSHTTLSYEDVVFDEKIPDSVFTQENMRKAR